MVNVHFKWIKNLPYIYRSERVPDTGEKTYAEKTYVGASKRSARGPKKPRTKVVTELIAPYWKYYYMHSRSWRQMMDADMVRWMMVNEEARVEYLDAVDAAIDDAKARGNKFFTQPSGRRKNIVL